MRTYRGLFNMYTIQSLLSMYVCMANISSNINLHINNPLNPEQMYRAVYFVQV